MDQATNSPAILALAEGQNIWLGKSDKIELKIFNESGNKLEFSESEVDYQNYLTAFLIKLSCENKWVASGIIRYRTGTMSLKTSFAQCLLSLKDKKDESGPIICPGVFKSSKEDIERLKRMTAVKQPENKIKTTFECETSIFD